MQWLWSEKSWKITIFSGHKKFEPQAVIYAQWFLGFSLPKLSAKTRVNLMPFKPKIDFTSAYQLVKINFFEMVISMAFFEWNCNDVVFRLVSQSTWLKSWLSLLKLIKVTLISLKNSSWTDQANIQGLIFLYHIQILIPRKTSGLVIQKKMLQLWGWVTYYYTSDGVNKKIKKLILTILKEGEI